MKHRKPLGKLWQVISIPLSVLGLSSLSDNIIAWKFLIPELIHSYKTIVNFPFLFMNISIHPLLIDYLFIGSLCGVSFVKAMNFAENNRLISSHGMPIIVRIVYFFLYLIAWPLGILISIKQILFKDTNNTEIIIKSTFLQWVGATFLAFIILLIINNTFW